jgi:hypothetical protein
VGGKKYKEQMASDREKLQNNWFYEKANLTKVHVGLYLGPNSCNGKFFLYFLIHTRRLFSRM